MAERRIYRFLTNHDSKETELGGSLCTSESMAMA